jgi:hypothetical protein
VRPQIIIYDTHLRSEIIKCILRIKPFLDKVGILILELDKEEAENGGPIHQLSSPPFAKPDVGREPEYLLSAPQQPCPAGSGHYQNDDKWMEA